MTHPENVMPFCVKHFRIRDAKGNVIAEETANYQGRRTLALNPALITDRLIIECLESNGPTPAAVFEVRCYEE